jgi:hypothetical protein
LTDLALLVEKLMPVEEGGKYAILNDETDARADERRMNVNSVMLTHAGFQAVK